MKPSIRGTFLQGEAREVGRVVTGLTRERALRGEPLGCPVSTQTILGSGSYSRELEERQRQVLMPSYFVDLAPRLIASSREAHLVQGESFHAKE
ncbi:MAG: hypothetical protein M3120_02455 [Pseudomonadota bacterium]|nr:hypothetical protein [Pseudomonadota bacterium]